MIRTRTIGILLMLGNLNLGAQYISKVLEYTPAPGQHINSAPWGDNASASTLVGGVDGSLSLGAYGGTVVFAFDSPVENHPDNPYGVDFTIFGNPLPDWSEPGVVWVMKDENGNGEADDTWYQLAGSDYYFTSTLHDYGVSYSNPGGTEARDVPWEDQFGNQGIIKANSTHAQSYYPQSDYFPHIPADAYELRGTLISGAVDVDHPPANVSRQRAFGYADNRPRGAGPHTLPDNPYTEEVENSGGDAFDISWAVDASGMEVALDQIHFVKVQNGLLHQGGWLGELSTEITGAVDVAPDPLYEGNLDMLVIGDLPSELDTTACQLEVFFFRRGKPEALPEISWTSSEPWAVVDAQQHLSVSGTGALTLTATVAGKPELRASVYTLVTSGVHTSLIAAGEPGEPGLYPNPALEVFYISGVDGGDITLVDLSGKILRKIKEYRSGQEIEISGLLPGMYLVRIGDDRSSKWMKLLKR